MKRNVFLRLFAAAILVAGFAGAFRPQTRVYATTNPVLTVNSDADENVSDEFLTLREAILISNGGTGQTGLNRPVSEEEQAQAPDCVFDTDGKITDNCGAGFSETIEFSFTSASVISLTLALPVISDAGFSLTISGPEVANLEINGGHSVRVFEMATGVTASISYLTIADGYGNGAGILNRGTLTLRDSVLTDNASPPLGYGGGLCNLWGSVTVTNVTFAGNIAADGSAIYNTGTLSLQNSSMLNNGESGSDNGGGLGNFDGQATVTNSTFSGNQADNGGAIFNSGTLTLQASTLLANSSTTGYGGGLYNGGGTATVTNVTYTGNNAADGGAIYNTGGVINLYSSTLYDNAVFGSSSVHNVSSRLTAKNTIIASSAVGDSCEGYQFESASVANISDDTSCGASFTQKTIAEINLGPLADNGGPTQTFALLLDSAATNAGDDASCPSTDQRGVARPKGAHCDVGSFEVDVSSLSVVPSSITFDDEPANTTSAPQIVTVTNASSEDAHITLVSITGEFLLDNNTCNYVTLSSGESCSFTVAFYPLTTGSKTGKVSIASDSPTSPDTIALSGLGISSTQLLRNGGFDNYSKPLVWRLGKPVEKMTAVLDCTVYVTPFCSVRFIGTSFNIERTIAQWVHVHKKGLAGMKYYIALDSRAENVPAGGEYKVVVYFYNSRKLVLTKTLEFTPGTHDFETLRTTVIVPEKHNAIRYVIYYQNTSGTVWFDAAFLTQLGVVQ